MKTAVIGAGVICEQHMAALRRITNARIVAVCDRSRAMADFAGERFAAERAFTDHRHMLDAAKPDIVHILTPAASHPQLVRDCLSAASHVIVEKPAALAHDQLRDLCDLANRRSRYLVEDHNYRFNAPIRRIDNLIAQGRLGAIEEVEIRIALDLRAPAGRYADLNCPHPSHRLPAGVIHEFITHMAYLTLHFLPSAAAHNRGATHRREDRDSHEDSPTFDRVAAAWNNHGNASGNNNDETDPFKYDDLDALIIAGSAHARLRFSARLQPASFHVAVRGSAGFAETDLFHPYLRAVTPRPGGQQLAPIVNHLANSCAFLRAAGSEFANKLQGQSAYDGLHEFIAATYHAIENGDPPPVSPNDMHAASRLVDALIEAGAANQGGTPTGATT